MSVIGYCTVFMHGGCENVTRIILKIFSENRTFGFETLCFLWWHLQKRSDEREDEGRNINGNLRDAIAMFKFLQFFNLFGYELGVALFI